MNLFAHLDPNTEEEKVDIMYRNAHARVERIVSSGQVSPEGFWYEQDEDEWVLVLQGEGRILPAGKRHRVSYTSQNPPCIWLCVFSGKEVNK